MADNLEDRVKNTESDNDKANGHNSPLEIKVLEEQAKKRKPRGFLGKMIDYTIAGAAFATSYALVGSAALIANAIGFVGDRIINYQRKRDTPSRQTRDTAIMSSLFSIPGHYFFKWVNQAINVKTWSGLLGRFAVQNLAYAPPMYVAGNLVGYPLTHGTTKGLWNYGIKDLGWRNYKDSIKRFSIPNLVAARYAPPQTHFPISLGLGMLWKTTLGSRFLHEADPYKYEHKIIDGKPANITDINDYRQKPPANMPLEKAA